jgi:hypothetical protein
MRKRRLLFTVLFLAAIVGCNREPLPQPQSGSESPSGPGRFVHSAIQKSTAPWDGPATALLLGEKPLVEGTMVAPCLSVRINQSATDLSGKRVHVEAKENRTGWAQWLPKDGKAGDLSWVEVEFEEIHEDQPVNGIYDAAFPDGSHARGRFQAIWWASEGRGG